MKIKAIVFDLDGTAVDSPDNNHPSDRLVRAVSALKNRYFLCAATGRGWSYGKDVLKSLELEDLCVIAAGTQICNPKTGEIVWQKNIEARDLDRVLKIFRQYPEQSMLFNDYTLDDYLKKNFRVKDCVIEGDVFFLELVDLEVALAEKIAKEIEKIEGVSCLVLMGQHRVNHRDIHVTNALATKEQAIEQLLKLIGIERKDTIGIGDGGNDLHLFNGVKKKIAMGNAVTSLKSLADLVIGSVKEDGLAEYFESLT